MEIVNIDPYNRPPIIFLCLASEKTLEHFIVD